jgi:hypothetical protein
MLEAICRTVILIQQLLLQDKSALRRSSGLVLQRLMQLTAAAWNMLHTQRDNTCC